MSTTQGLRSRSRITAQQAIAAAEAIATSQDRIKQPMNAYILWSCNRRPQLAREHKRMKPHEISQRMGAEWKLLTKTEKAPFLKEAERLKAVFLKEHPEYRMRKTKKGIKLGSKRQADREVDEEQPQQKDQVPYGKQQHLDDEEEAPNPNDFNGMSPSNSPSAVPVHFEQKSPSNELQVPIDELEQKQLLLSNEEEQQLLLPINEQEQQQPLPSKEPEQQQLLRRNEQEQQQPLPRNEQEQQQPLPSKEPEQQQLVPNNEKEQQLMLPRNEQVLQQTLPSNEQEQQQLLPSNDQRQQQVLPINEQEQVCDVEVEVPYDDQQLQHLDVEQELLPNNNDANGMLTGTSNSFSAQVENCQQNVAGNEAQHRATVNASFEPVPQLNHLTGIKPYHTSAFSAPTARYGPMFHQYGQVPSQQQLGYSGWGYPVSHPPLNSYAASTSTGYLHLGYNPPAHCPTPPGDDSLELGVRFNGEGKKTRQPRTSFSSVQLEQLKSQFQRDKHPTPLEESELAASLGLTHVQVKTWFQNRRAKFKSMVKAAQEFGYGGFDGLEGHPHQQLQQVNHVPASHHQVEGVYHPYMQQQLGQAAAGHSNPNSAPAINTAITGRGFCEPRQFNPTIISNSSL